MSQLEYLSDRNLIPCVCGAWGGVVIKRKDRYQLKFQYKLCTKCGHVRTANPISTKAAERFYGTSDYRSMYLPGMSSREVLLSKTPKPHIISPLLKYVQELGIEAGSLIEWGCSGGWNLIPFRDAGWKVSGFDYDKQYVALGRDEFGLSLHEIERNDDLDIRSQSPDVVLLNHVLEHAEDPLSLLKRLRRICGIKTTLIVGVPLLETITLWRWQRFFHVAHIHYFSEDSLVAVARHSGFEVVHRDVNSGLFALRLNEQQVTQWPGRKSAIRSSAAIFRSFVDPKYRLLLLARNFIKTLGLLHLVVRLKAKLRR